MCDLICLCGKVGSGKSTYGALLKNKHKAVMFDMDGLMYPLFDESLDRNTFDKKFNICADYIYGISKQILNSGISVILDFGFWRKSDREKIKSYFAGYRYKFVYLKTEIEEQLKRIEDRNKAGISTYGFTKEAVLELNELFEEPNKSNEKLNLEIVICGSA